MAASKTKPERKSKKLSPQNLGLGQSRSSRPSSPNPARQFFNACKALNVPNEEDNQRAAQILGPIPIENIRRNPDLESLGQAIHLARTKMRPDPDDPNSKPRAWSLQEFARRTEIDRTRLQLIEEGKVSLTVIEMLYIMSAIRLPFDAFFEIAEALSGKPFIYFSDEELV